MPDHNPFDQLIPETEFQIPNLDLMDPEVLDAVAGALTALARYAAITAKAHRARLAGTIQEAIRQERAAEEIYRRLPASWKW